MINMKYNFENMSYNDLAKYNESIQFAKKTIEEMEKDLIKYMIDSKKYREKYSTIQEYAQNEFGWTRQTLYNKIV